MAQVTVDLGNGQTIKPDFFVEVTNDLGLKLGDETRAVVKSTDVMIVID